MIEVAETLDHFQQECCFVNASYNSYQLTYQVIFHLLSNSCFCSKLEDCYPSCYFPLMRMRGNFFQSRQNSKGSMSSYTWPFEVEEHFLFEDIRNSHKTF